MQKKSKGIQVLPWGIKSFLYLAAVSQHHPLLLFCAQTDSACLKKLGYTKSKLTLNLLPLTDGIFYILNYFQVKMSANQSTTAVSIFVLMLTIPTSASVVKDSYWEKMARPAEVSDWYLLNTFACTRKERGIFLLPTGKEATSFILTATCFHSKPTFISIIPRTGHLQISQPWLWAYLC